MTQRKYSLDEIDRIRAFVEYEHDFGEAVIQVPAKTTEEYIAEASQTAATATCSHISYYPAERAAVVEERVRTLMAAGTDPADCTIRVEYV